MAELWMDINDCPNYTVSSNGRVMNKNTGKVLKPRPDRKGYQRVSVRCDDGMIHDKLIHRIVADAFYDGDHDGLDVNHIDGKKDNNFIGNLEFCTRSDNLKHAYRTDLREPPQNRCRPIRIVETGQTYKSVRDCSRQLGCNHSIISNCLNHRQKKYKGYRFEYV